MLEEVVTGTDGVVAELEEGVTGADGVDVVATEGVGTVALTANINQGDINHTWVAKTVALTLSQCCGKRES